MNPPPTLRVDVTGLTPADAHAAILANLDDIAAGPTPATGGDIAAAMAALFAGVRRIIERHAPTMTEALPWRPSTPQCETCAALCHSSSGILCEQPVDGPWPCADYLDAAAMLATGLPTGV
jgi:hypothetical protein